MGNYIELLRFGYYLVTLKYTVKGVSRKCSKQVFFSLVGRNG
jgi:hypothetical protein